MLKPFSARRATQEVGERAENGKGARMRLGRNVEVRPLGGGAGCLGMLLVSLVLSVLLTIIVNVIL